MREAGPQDFFPSQCPAVAQALQPEERLRIVCELTCALSGALSTIEILEITKRTLLESAGVASVVFGAPDGSAHAVDREVAVALTAGSEIFGTILLHLAPSEDPAAAETFFATIGRLCGQALERAGLRSAESEARASLAGDRAYLENILETLPSGVAIAEAPTGKLLVHNADAVRLLRHPLLACDDWSGYARYGAMHDAATPYRPEEYPITRALSGETVRHERMLYRRGDGTFAHFLVNAAPLRNPEGVVVAALSTFDDVSELIETQQALAVASERLTRVLESTTDAVLAVDSAWRITYMNRRAQSAIGDGRDLTGEILWDAFPNAIGSVFEERYRAAVASEKPDHFEAYYEPFQSWYDIHAYPDRGGLIVYFREINQQKNAEQERERLIESLRRSEERLSLAIQSTELGTFDFDPQSGSLNWSAQTKRHFGLPENAEVDYDIFLRGLHPDDRERVTRIVQEVLRPEGGGWYATEYRTIGLEDGRERWISAGGRVLFDSEGHPIRFIGVTRDITQRKRVEEQLRDAQKLESIGLLAGGVAHDPSQRDGTCAWRSAIPASGWTMPPGRGSSIPSSQPSSPGVGSGFRRWPAWSAPTAGPCG